MTTLTEFITARLDHHETTARAATLGHWQAHYSGRQEDYQYWAISGRDLNRDTTNSMEIAGCGLDGGGGIHTQADAEHIAANHTVYVLADIAAKRSIVEDYLIVLANNAIADATQPDKVRSAGRDLIAKTLRMVLLRLASAWADHPDYDQSWRPEKV